MPINAPGKQTDLLLSEYDVLYILNSRSENRRLIYQLDKSAVSNKVRVSYSQADNFLRGELNLTLKLSAPTGSTILDTTRIYFTRTAFRIRLRK